MGLEWVNLDKARRVLMCSDSASVLLGSYNNRPDIPYDIIRKQSSVVRQGTTVVFLWVPSHLGIVSNE